MNKEQKSYLFVFRRQYDRYTTYINWIHGGEYSKQNTLDINSLITAISHDYHRYFRVNI